MSPGSTRTPGSGPGRALVVDDPVAHGQRVFSTFAIVLGLMVVGRALAWLGVAGDRVADVLNRAAIAVFFPALILQHAPGLHLEPALLLVPVVAWAVIAAGVVTGVLLHRRGLAIGPAVAVALGLGFGNTAFLGYTLVPALVPADVGDEALRIAVVSDQLGSFIGVSTVGLLAVSLAAGGPRPGLAEMLRRIVVFPPFIALVIGVTVMPATPPDLVAVPLLWLGRALLPAMAIALGLRLRFVVPHADRAPLIGVVVGKLLAMPALALLLALLLGVDGTARQVVVLQAGMPIMVTIGALLTFANVAVELAAAMVALSTVASLLTLPAWAALLRAI
jgi:malate permease and related proteins